MKKIQLLIIISVKEWEKLSEFITNFKYFDELNKSENQIDLYLYWRECYAQNPINLEQLLLNRYLIIYL